MTRHLFLLLLSLVITGIAVAQPAKGRRVVTGSIFGTYRDREIGGFPSDDGRSISVSAGYGWFLSDLVLLSPGIDANYFEEEVNFSNSSQSQINRQAGIRLDLTYFKPLTSEKFYLLLGSRLSYGVGRQVNQNSFNQGGERKISTNVYGLRGFAGLGYAISERWFLQTELGTVRLEYTNSRFDGLSTDETRVELSSLLNNFGIGASYFLR